MASKEGASAAAPSLVPSQVSASQGSNKQDDEKRRKPRRRGGSRNKNGKNNEAATNPGSEQPQLNQETSHQNSNEGQKKKNRRRNGGKKAFVSGEQSQQESTDQNSEQATKPPSKSLSTKKAFARRKHVKRRGKCPWKKHIPPGTMDPITLDPLVSLPYPPFAIVATEPYVSVPEWPIPESGRKEAVGPQTVDKEEEHRRRLEEQWGTQVLPSVGVASQEEPKLQPEALHKDRHYHLYDGRALAYYLVSQLQFIDPLNRRDLTRDELANLDNYLGKHGFGGDMKVVEAYDAKGITMSTAGRAGQSAAGRAEIMQQEAQVLLNALFGNGTPSVSSPVAPGSGGLRELYNASQNQGERRGRGNRTNRQFESDDPGIYVEEDQGGLILIDDDANPGLRGGGFRSVAQANASLDVGAAEFVPHTSLSGIDIANRHSHATRVRQYDFPSLPTTAGNSQPASAVGSAVTTDKKPASRSLQRITKVVEKTDPAQLQRQREAREEAIRRAALANMAFVPPGSVDTSSSTMMTLGTMREGQGFDVVKPSAAGPTEGQLERNRNLAAALDVAPSTIRQQNFHSGWVRPTTADIELDQFGNELNAAQYPDSLILEARENMTELLRLEKKWKTFLADDTSASLPLKPMLRPLRKFCHEYSDFWKLHTESFDREPKRYIHCVKMRDTSAPHPLLSEAARNWRGPGQLPPQKLPSHEGEHVSHQTAGQSTVSREFPPGPPREPLQLLSRSSEIGSSAAATLVERSDTQTDAQLKSRFDSLSMGKERIRLELAPRTIPAELPPFQPPQNAQSTSADVRLKEEAEARARKAREAEEQKRRILEAAFASGSEDGEASLSSGWEEEEELYSSSSGDEETAS